MERKIQNISIIQFSHSVVSNSLWPHGLQYVRLPCPSPTPRAYSNSCPLSRWFHPTISSSVVLFISCLQLFPASGSFPMSQFFASGGQSIGVSTSTSVLPMNIKAWFHLGWLIGSPWSPRDSQKSSPTPLFKSINSSALSFLYSPTLIPHSSTIAWKIPWTEEPSRVQSMGSLRDMTERLHFHFSLSCIGEGNGNPLQCSCLENSMGRGVWWATIYSIAKSWTRLKWLSNSSNILPWLLEKQKLWLGGPFLTK